MNVELNPSLELLLEVLELPEVADDVAAAGVDEYIELTFIESPDRMSCNNESCYTCMSTPVALTVPEDSSRVSAEDAGSFAPLDTYPFCSIVLCCC